MKYLKQFANQSDYQAFKESEEYITPNVSYVVEGEFVSFNPNVFDMRDNYLTIEAIEDDLTVSLNYPDYSESFNGFFQYCIDGDGNWKNLASGTNTENINAGQTLSFRGNVVPDGSNGCGRFTISKKCNLMGNIMSLLYGDDTVDKFTIPYEECFFDLFSGNPIINASKLILPATDISAMCYYSMFLNCTSLTTAPELPATTLANSCYRSMFDGCTSLTTAPELPATTLVNQCYQDMFYGCSKLNYIKMLATDISASRCLSSWISGVASTGTFVKNSAMNSLPTGASGIPSGWTVQDAA